MSYDLMKGDCNQQPLIQGVQENETAADAKGRSYSASDAYTPIIAAQAEE